MPGVSVPRLRLISGRYFWRPTDAIRALGFKNEPLGADKDKAQELAARFNAAVARALKTEPAEPVPGTVPAVIRDYRTSPEFDGLSDATKRGYRNILSRIEAAFPAQAVATVGRQDLRLIARGMKDRPRLAKEYIKLWSIILGHAIEMGLRSDNPALGMRVKGSPGRQTLWTIEQLDALCAAAMTQRRQSVALASRLAYETSQRLTDILALPWTAIEGDVIRVKQGKTGERIAVPISPELQAHLKAAPRGNVVVVISEGTKRPYKMENFDRVFAAVRKAAGLPSSLWFRDLRRTALTEAGRGGATALELQSLGGHKTMQQLSTYVIPSAAAAREAVRKRNKVAKDSE